MYILISMQRRMQGRGGAGGPVPPPFLDFFLQKQKLVLTLEGIKGVGSI